MRLLRLTLAGFPFPALLVGPSKLVRQPLDTPSKIIKIIAGSEYDVTEEFWRKQVAQISNSNTLSHRPIISAPEKCPSAYDSEVLTLQSHRHCDATQSRMAPVRYCRSRFSCILKSLSAKRLAKMAM
jgi:hypothetical protein